MIVPGVHEDISESGLKTKYPGVVHTREFVSGVLSSTTDLRPKVQAVAQGSWDAGLIPIVSIKTSPSSTATGSYDTRFNELGTYLATKPETWIIWYHEPEDDMSGPTFRDAFNRARAEMKQTFPGLKVGYSAMAYQWRPSSTVQSTDDPVPWRVVADFYSIDAYSGGSFPATYILPEHPGFIRWYNELVVPAGGASKWGVTERGWKESGNDSGRATQIRREKDWLLSLPVTAYTEPTHWVYWNTTGTENDPNLLNGPLATAALQETVAALADEEEPVACTPAELQAKYDEGYAAGFAANCDPEPPPGDTVVPADVLDLTNWKITLPIGPSNDATEIEQPQLDTYELDPYFITVPCGDCVANGTDKAVRFRAHAGGSTTSGSEYPRSELREMANGGTTEASWSSTSGEHTLRARLKATAAPPVKPQVTLLQIHDSSDDVIGVLYDGFRNDITVRYLGATQTTPLLDNYTLGTWFNVKIVAGGGRIKIYANTAPTLDFQAAEKIFDFTRSFSGGYFKAGAYTQSNVSKGDAPDAYGEAIFDRVYFTHI